jgi:hypothetical protein
LTIQEQADGPNDDEPEFLLADRYPALKYRILAPLSENKSPIAIGLIICPVNIDGNQAKAPSARYADRRYWEVL